MKIKTRFAISNIIMLAAPIVLIGAISIVCLILFVMRFPVEEISITRAQILNPTNFMRALSVFFEKNPSAVYYIAAWAGLSLLIVIACTTAVTQLLSHSIRKPISDISEAAEKIGAGELDFDVLGSDYDEINSLCEKFNNMRMALKNAEARASAMNTERNMLLANLSHDLKTPLTSIKGYINGIQDGVANTPEKLSQYLDTIYSKAMVLDSLVENLSEYSRLEMSRMSFEFKDAEMNSFICDFLEEYRLDLERNNMALTVSLCPEPTPVRLDMQKMARVFSNIINNSVKYKDGDSGSIAIETYIEGKGVYTEISDSGVGIRPEEEKQVFDAFYRTDKSRSVSGSGLGLGIAKQIVEKHEGKIWMKSAHKGVTTIIYLPLEIV